MSLQLRWVGTDELDRVAETRALCYAHAAKDVEGHRQQLRDDRRQQPGDFLLAERDGRAVGTITSLSLTMWVRGVPLPCQGIAYVGTIKTHRRGGSGGEPGVATQLMHEALRMARQRQQVISALMPFRASFYEHFGYGLIEQRVEWTVPVTVLPSGRFDSIRFLESDDLPAVYECRRQMVRKGQCDVERPTDFWPYVRRNAGDCMEIVDAPEPRVVRGYLRLQHFRESDRNLLRVVDHVWDSPEALLRQLYFLGSLRDQYSAVALVLPPDLPLNLLLKETQLAHRPVEHPVARATVQTRTQARIIDHKRFLELLELPPETSGKTTVAIAETEGSISILRLDLSQGRMSVSPGTSSADLECTDKTWASIACGELDPQTAVDWGLARLHDARAIAVLRALSKGPRPFLTEAF